MSKPEIAIRYVHGKDDMGARPMLGLRGKKVAYCVGVEYDKIYSLSIPVQYFDKAANVLRYNDPYPIQRYLDMLEEKSKKPTARISSKAKQILQLARNPDNFDEDLLADLEDEPPEDAGTGSPGRGSDAGDGGRMPASEKPGKGKIGASSASAPGKRPKPAAITSTAAGKPEKRGRGRPPGSAGSGLIARIAAELKVDAAHLRKACRAGGLHAPYEDERAIKAAWKKHG